MRKIKTFKAVEKGDWLFWIEIKGTARVVSIVSSKDYSEEEKEYTIKESACWDFDIKKPNEFHNYDTNSHNKFGQNFFDNYNIFILNKSEINKYKLKITLQKI